MGFHGENIPGLKIMDCSLRLLVIPFSIASIWLTVTNHQEDSSYGDLVYSNLTGLKYMVCISAISLGYTFLAAVSLWVRFLVSKVWIFFVSDQVVAYLMVTSAATMTEIIYLAYNGDQEVTWSEACNTYGRFCNRLKLVLALHVISLCCFLLLSVISAYRLFTRFEPPSLPSKGKEEEQN